MAVVGTGLQHSWIAVVFGPIWPLSRLGVDRIWLSRGNHHFVGMIRATRGAVTCWDVMY